jgi:SAM-dependent methyltransferase
MVGTLEETREALASEWTGRSPSTPEEIAQFYRESECLSRDLEAWHTTPERQAWTQAVVAVATGNKVQNVLDVGAGIGADLKAVLAACPDVKAVAIEPNDVMRGQLAYHMNIAADISEISETFDLVICIDVLEHVAEPVKLLEQIAERVKLGGLLVEATATHDQSTPLHLPQHAEWEPIQPLQEMGFKPVEQVGRLVVWQRDKIVDEATVIVVAHREVAAPTVECLFELNAFGWPIVLRYGDALIDRARAKAVSDWYRNETTDVFLMIDDDIVFKAEDAVRVVELAREKRAIACGAYPVGGGEHMASRGWPGQELHWGPTFEAVEIRWPATGFMAVHRDVITALTETMALCYPTQADAFWPMFQPFALGENYLSEDYAFGERARELGFATWMDPKTILHHLKIQALSVLNMKGVNREEQPNG